MTTVEIRDDPSHSEGGHAIILFRNVVLPDGEATLLIEPMTDGFDYAGPRRLDVAGHSTGGFEMAVGPAIVAALDPGIAVRLSVEGASVEAETLWPALTPLRAQGRRVAMAPGAARRVVSNGTPDKPVAVDDAKQAALATALAKDQQKLSADRAGLDKDRVALEAEKATLQSKLDAVAQREAALEQREALVQKEAVVEKETPPVGEEDVVTKPVKTFGRRTAAAAVAAGIAGAALVGLIWFAADRRSDASFDASLPSPYLLLTNLKTKGPDGKPVDEKTDPARFRRLADTASSEGDRAFWSEWALRRFLRTNKDDIAAILTDFGTALATSDDREPSQSAGRMMWEMAAVAGDCGAIKNLVTSLTTDKQAVSAEPVSAWKARAATCPSGATSSK